MIWRSLPLIVVVLLCYMVPRGRFNEAFSDLGNLLTGRALVYTAHTSGPPVGILSRKVVEFVTAMNEGRLGLMTLRTEMPDLRNPYFNYEEELDQVWEGTVRVRVTPLRLAEN